MALFWCLCALVLTVPVRSDELDVKQTLQVNVFADAAAASRCHQCAANKTHCESPPVSCPPDRPRCATVATSPDFESSLICAAPKTSQCSLAHDGKLHLTCTCTGHLCSAPYTAQLKNELRNFSTKIPENTTVALAEFLNSTIFANVTIDKLYRTITERKFQMANTSSLGPAVDTPIGPVAEALKHEVTVSPDDEDDGEGSGTFDDKQPPSAPAAPSSFLPSEHNDSTNTFGFSFHIVTTLTLHIIFVLTYS